MTYPYLKAILAAPCVKCGALKRQLAWSARWGYNEGFSHLGLKTTVPVPDERVRGGLVAAMCASCGYYCWCLPLDYVEPIPPVPPSPTFEELARQEVEGICTSLEDSYHGN